MVDNRNAVAAVPDHGTVDWGQDILNLVRFPCLVPALCPCLFVPGGDNLVRDSPDVMVGEAVAGTSVGW